MIWLLALAFATPDLTHTAETLDAGAVVVRLPTGPSAVGLTDGTDLFVTPWDVGIGGPRVGVEQAVMDFWSLRPSLGTKTTGKRTSVRLDSTVSTQVGKSQFSASIGADLRLLRRVELGTERTSEWSIDRIQIPLNGIWDWTANRSTIRTRVTLPLRDRGQTLTYGTGSVSYLHDFGKLHTETGVGLLLGRPRDAIALDTYDWFFTLPYPKLDMWMVF